MASLNLADYKSDSVRRWVETNSPTPKTTTTPTNNDATTKKTKLQINNNNTIDLLPHNFWKQQQRDLISGDNEIDMPMLLQQPPSHVLLSSHETDQPLDFTMSKFKTKSHHHHHHHHNNTVASQLKNQFNNFTTQQHMMLLQTNGIYFNRTNNNNRNFTRGSSPSSSSEEEGVGPPASSPNSSLPSPGPLRSDGKF